ncbi:retrovirus-related pol polyprotein from transposon TNT 1-94 [Tanacetum coccineum]
MTKNSEEHGLMSTTKAFKIKVWTLVDLPYVKRAIGTKWVYRNKKDERGIVVRNKARLVAQGYTQEDGIDYDEVFAPIARIEAIRLFLAYASFMNFVVYQMDVKSAFLYGKIEEEVYVCQPLGFKDPEFPDRVYKVEKALYGLHQALKACLVGPCITRSLMKELLSPFENPEQKFRLKRRLFDTPSLIESNSLEFDHILYIKEQSEERERETMTETMEQYMSKTRENYGSGVTRPTINQDTPFELKGQFLKELYDNTFSGSEHDDANEHIKKVLEIVDLFHIPKVTQDQVMLQAFPVSLTGAASRWLRNQPSRSITTWEILKTKFLNKYCPPARIIKKMEEINNFQQEPDESLFRTWERFKELLMKCPQHYLTDMRWINTLRNGTMEHLLGPEGPHYTKDCPQKEEGKILEEAYYTQLGAPYQPGGQYRAAGPGFYQRNNRNSSYQRPILEESLTKFMAESAKRHEENSNMIKEIRASTEPRSFD